MRRPHAHKLGVTIYEHSPMIRVNTKCHNAQRFGYEQEGRTGNERLGAQFPYLRRKVAIVIQ
ncbi:hypothetical protein J2R76_003947 [Bradyrhizobium sp. USDA 4532]|nr:hypothetical protein [Bradyrhizobium sp. USDA 4545]MCP1920356.1 hypothetical protein [Bradyrhizobium sp. USDA 4532]